MQPIAQLTFAQPALLLGSAAALLPLVIHLLLRPRPRRARFPAIALLRRQVLSGQRANRLRNLTLMLVRCLLLGSVAALLAGPTCTPAATRFVGSQPLACAIVLDDSASTGYRVDRDTTRLNLSCEQIRALLGQSATWPEGSALALVRARPGAEPGTLSADRALVSAALQASPAPAHSQPLGAALQAAAQLLRAAEQPAKRLVVFTDGAAHAWEDVTSGLLAGLDDLVVRVVVPSPQPLSNLALLSITGPTRRHPAPAAVPLQASISAEGLDGECWLVVRAADSTLRRVGPLRIPAGNVQVVQLELPAMPPGAHALTLEIEPADRLDFDQRRHLAFESADPPAVWLVSPAGTTLDRDLSALIVRNLLAPAVLPSAEQRVELITCTPERLPDAPPPALVVIISPAELAPAARERLQRAVERGTTALLIPGSTDRACDWPGLLPLLSTTAATSDTPSTLTTLRWEPASPYAAIADLAELQRCGVRRRVLLGELPAEVLVQARYADGEPAIVSRPQGSGQLMLLTTSPDPEWSDLGIRAAGLMSWLHLLVDEAAGPPRAVTTFTLGERSQHSFGNLPAGGLVRVDLDSATDARPVWLRLKGGRPQQPWPTDRVGRYTVQAAGAGERSTLYVVNMPPEESRLTPITLPQLRERLGDRHVRLETHAADGVAERAALFGRLFATDDVRLPLAGVLLMLFLLELGLANRRRGPPQRPT